MATISSNQNLNENNVFIDKKYEENMKIQSAKISSHNIVPNGIEFDPKKHLKDFLEKNNLIYKDDKNGI